MVQVGADAGQDVYESEGVKEQERARLKKERRDFRKQQELVCHPPDKDCQW